MEAIMLVCAVLASLALGVLVSYGICQVMFRVFRTHSIALAGKRAAKSAAVAVA